MRDAIKARLLEIVVSEPVPITRHAIARVISEVAEYELPEKAWPQLLGFLIKATDSPVAHEREVAILTLSSLMDTIADSYAENLPQIYALFAKTLQDPESLEVRVTTVQALGREFDEEAFIASFQAMIPQMLVVIGQTLEAGDENAAKEGFDTLETLLIIEVPLINAHFTQVVEFNATIGNNKSLDKSQ
ncbi:Importin [Puccinia graminis f. sp. tritici]|uniref:Importin n=1 Tax=Puccinia graminis f. sp. tritici TaxID=56615 RepID=A0A5B0MN45_PUCGR|nr:Importin [Puccinia graminis f. sp. tritici]KAA1077792.1 Importin [Puccinia graminis f. sp. tritici]